MIAIPIMLSNAIVRANTIDIEVTTRNVLDSILSIFKILKSTWVLKYRKDFELQSKMELFYKKLLKSVDFAGRKISLQRNKTG